MTRTYRLDTSTRLATAMFSALVAIAACTGGAPSSDADTGSPSGRPSHSLPARVSPDPPAPVTGEVPAAIVDAARVLLADAVGAEAAAAATLVVAEAVTWPDGSLGGPEARGVYTQQRVRGQRHVF